MFITPTLARTGLLAALIGVIAGSAFATKPHPVNYDHSVNGKTIKVRANAQFSVTLEKLGGVRGNWEWISIPPFLSLDPKKLKIVPPTMPGGLEKFIYHFDVLKTGVGLLRASRGPIQSFSVTVKSH